MIIIIMIIIIIKWVRWTLRMFFSYKIDPQTHKINKFIKSKLQCRRFLPFCNFEISYVNNCVIRNLSLLVLVSIAYKY